MPKLKKAFGDAGVEIEDQNGELRSTFDILQDLAGKWDTLSSKQKQYLGEKAAGTRQVKVLNAIMANWDVVEDTVQKASEATGEATEGNEKYLDSIQGRITQFKSAFQDLARTTIDSGFVKGLVGIGTTIVGITTNLGGLVPVLTTISGIVIALKGAKIADSISKTLPALSKMFTLMKSGQTFMQAMSASLTGTAGIVGILLTVAGVAASVMSLIKNATPSLQDLESSASTAKQGYEEQKTKVEDLNSELKTTQDLIAEMNGRKLNIIEQDELSRLKENSAELQRQIDFENELLRIREREARESTNKASEAYDSQLVSDRSKYRGLQETVGTEYFRENVSYSQATQSFTPTNVELAKAISDALPQIKKNYNDALAEQKKYEDKISKGQASIEDKEYKALVENTKNAFKAMSANESFLKEYYTHLKDLYSGLSEVVKPQDDVDKYTNSKLQEIKSIEEAFSDASLVDEARDKQFDSITSRYSDSVDKLKEIFDESRKITEENLKTDSVSEMTEKFKKLGWTVKDVAEYLNTTFEINKINIPDLSSIDSIIERNYLATDSYKNLTAAMTEQSKAGSISMETYQQLMQDTDLASYLTKTADALKLTGDGFALNTDLMYDYIKAETDRQKREALVGWDDRIKKLQELQAEQKKLEEAGKSTAENQIQQNAIQSEIVALQAYIQELDSATGALARYKAAKSTANGDEDYTTGQSAYKDIVQGRKTGKVGTDDFKSAVDFVLGDDWKRNLSEFDGSVEKAYAEAQRLGKRYFGQKTDKAGGENFLKDVVKNGLGSFDKNGNFSFEEGATVEDIASKLKISEDAVKSLIKMLNTYAPEGEGFTLEGLIDENDTAAIEKQRKAIEEETSNLDELKKKRNQMLKEDPNADTSEIDKTIGETQQRLTDLEEGTEVNIETMSLEEAKDKIDELVRLIQQLSGDESITINLDSSQLSGAERIVSDLCSRFPELQSYLNEHYGVEITAKDNTQEGIDKAKESVNDVKQDTPTSLESEDNTAAGIADAKNSVNNVEQDKPTLLKAEADAVSLSAVDGAIQGIADKERTATINVTYKEGEPGPLQSPTGDQPQKDYRGERPANPQTSRGELPELEGTGETVTLDAEVEVEEGSIADAKSAFEDAWATEDAEIEPEVNGEGLAEKTQEALSNGKYVVEPEVKTPTPTPTPSPNPTPAPTPSPTKTSMEVDATVDDSEVQAYSPEDKNADVNFSPDFSKVTTAKVPDLKGKVRYTAVLPANAKGTTNAMKGPSLVDEEGPELIEHVQRGTYELGTNNGPRLTKLDKGDVVHTAEETKKILSRMGKIGGFFRNGLNQAKSVVGNAFATGVSGSLSWGKITKTLNSVRNSSGGNKGSGKAAGWGYAQWIEKLFDWAEIRLDRLKTITNTWLLSAAEAIGYAARNKELTNAIKSVEEEIDNTNKAYQLYMDQASLVAQKAGLADDIIEKIKDGSIEIAEYDKTVQDKIKNYQEW